MENIIKNINELDVDTKVAGLFNSELKKLGFKKAVIQQENIDLNEAVEENLTIFFKPCFSTPYSDKYYNRTAMSPLRDELRHLNGCDGLDGYTYYSNDNVIQNQITLKLETGGHTCTIGHYLSDRNIIIFYLPPYHNYWENSPDYIKRILEIIKQLAKEYKFKEVDTSKIIEKMFLDTFSKNVEDKIIGYNREVQDINNNIEIYEKQFITWNNTALTRKKEIIALEEIKKEIKSTLYEKVEAIKKLKFVKDVQLTKDGISFKFDRISIKARDKEVDMGVYTITLTPSTIKIRSSRPIEKEGGIYHSPHVYHCPPNEETNICFGNQQGVPHSLLGKLELKQLAHFLYLFLKSYNPESTYCSMNYWINAREKEEAEKKEKERLKKEKKKSLALAKKQRVEKIKIEGSQVNSPLIESISTSAGGI